MRAHRRGRFLGETGLLSGEPSFLTAVLREPGSVVVVSAAQLRALATNDVAIGDLILRAYLIPRAGLIELGAGFRIVGARHSAATQRVAVRPATGCPTGSSISRTTTRPTRSCVGSGCGPTRRRL